MKQATLEQPRHEPVSEKDSRYIRPPLRVITAISHLAIKLDDRIENKAAEKDSRKHRAA